MLLAPSHYRHGLYEPLGFLCLLDQQKIKRIYKGTKCFCVRSRRHFSQVRIFSIRFVRSTRFQFGIAATFQPLKPALKTSEAHSETF